MNYLFHQTANPNVIVIITVLHEGLHRFQSVPNSPVVLIIIILAGTTQGHNIVSTWPHDLPNRTYLLNSVT